MDLANEIAKSLTPSQKKALMDERGPTRTAKILFNAGLFGSISFDHPTRYAFLSRATDLGQSVREHINKE